MVSKGSLSVSRGKRVVRSNPPVRVVRIGVASLAVLSLTAGSVVALEAPKAALTAEPATTSVNIADRRSQEASRSAARAEGSLGEAGRMAAAVELDKTDLRKAAKVSTTARLKDLPEAKPAKAKGSVYTTKAINLRRGPSTDSSIAVTVPAGTKLQATTKTKGAWQQLSYSGKVAWVYDDYISSSKPSAAKSKSKSPKSKSSKPKTSRGDSTSRSSKRSSGSTPSGVSGSACSSSGVESGLQPNTIAVHRAICNTFGSMNSFGGTRGGGGNHGSGRALDAMVPNWSSGGGNALGWQVARYVRSNAGRLGVTEVIFDQKIWTTQRSGEGWRSMSSRGGATANHRDHVHISVR